MRFSAAVGRLSTRDGGLLRVAHPFMGGGRIYHRSRNDSCAPPLKGWATRGVSVISGGAAGVDAEAAVIGVTRAVVADEGGPGTFDVGEEFVVAVRRDRVQEGRAEHLDPTAEAALDGRGAIEEAGEDDLEPLARVEDGGVPRDRGEVPRVERLKRAPTAARPARWRGRRCGDVAGAPNSSDRRPPGQEAEDGPGGGIGVGGPSGGRR